MVCGLAQNNASSLDSAIAIQSCPLFAKCDDDLVIAYFEQFVEFMQLISVFMFS
jgi:hypothetical protein